MASSNRDDLTNSADIIAGWEKLLASGEPLPDDPRALYLSWVNLLKTKERKHELVKLISTHWDLQSKLPLNKKAHHEVIVYACNLLREEGSVLQAREVNRYGIVAFAGDKENAPTLYRLLEWQFINDLYLAAKLQIGEPQLVMFSKETLTEFEKLVLYADEDLKIKCEDSIKKLKNTIFASYLRTSHELGALAERQRFAKNYREEIKTLQAQIAALTEIISKQADSNECKNHLVFAYGNLSIAIRNQLNSALTPEVRDEITHNHISAVMVALSIESDGVMRQDLICRAGEDYSLALGDGQNFEECKLQVSIRKNVLEEREKIKRYKNDDSVFRNLFLDNYQLATKMIKLYEYSKNIKDLIDGKYLLSESLDYFKKIKEPASIDYDTRSTVEGAYETLKVSNLMGAAIYANDKDELDRLYPLWTAYLSMTKDELRLIEKAAVLGELPMIIYLMEKYKLVPTYDPDRSFSHFLLAVCAASLTKRTEIINWLYQNDRYLTLGGGMTVEHLDAAAGKTVVESLSDQNPDAKGLTSAHYALYSGIDYNPAYFELSPFQIDLLKNTVLLRRYISACRHDLMSAILIKYPDLDIDWTQTPGEDPDFITILAKVNYGDLIPNIISRNKNRRVDLQVKDPGGKTLEAYLIAHKQHEILDKIKRHNAPIEMRALMQEKEKMQEKVKETPAVKLAASMATIFDEVNISHSISIDEPAVSLSFDGPVAQVRSLYQLLKEFKQAPVDFKEGKGQGTFKLKGKLSGLQELMKNNNFIRVVKQKCAVTKVTKVVPVPVKDDKPEQSKHLVLSAKEQDAWRAALERTFCHAKEAVVRWDDAEKCIIVNCDTNVNAWLIRKPGSEDDTTNVPVDINADVLREILTRVKNYFNVSNLEGHVAYDGVQQSIKIYVIKADVSSFKSLEDIVYAKLNPNGIVKKKSEPQKGPTLFAKSRTSGDGGTAKITPLSEADLKQYFAKVINDIAQHFLFLSVENVRDNLITLSYNSHAVITIGAYDSVKLFTAIKDAINKEFPKLIEIDITRAQVHLKILSSAYSKEALYEKLDTVIDNYNKFIVSPPVQSAPLPTAERLVNPAKPASKEEKITLHPSLSAENKNRNALINALCDCDDGERASIAYHLKQLKALPHPTQAGVIQHYYYAYLIHAFRLSALLAHAVNKHNLRQQLPIQETLFYTLRKVIRHGFNNENWHQLYDLVNPLVADLSLNLDGLKGHALGSALPEDLVLNKNIFLDLEKKLNPYLPQLDTKSLGRMTRKQKDAHIEKYRALLQSLEKGEGIKEDNWRRDATVMLHALIGKSLRNETTRDETDDKDLHRTLGHKGFEMDYETELANTLLALCPKPDVHPTRTFGR